MFAPSPLMTMVFAAALAAVAGATGCKSSSASNPLDATTSGSGGGAGNLDAGPAPDLQTTDAPGVTADAPSPNPDVAVDAPGGVDASADALADASIGASDTGGTDAAIGRDATGSDAGPPGSIATALDITDVWSGHPVGFALLTQGNQQFAAFYDANRQMTIASRTLDSPTWRLVRLATTLGWDSHNYIAMAIDGGGFIHVAGNMHAVPLIYFRSTQPLDIGTFARVTSMVGSNEQSCTYPQFINGPSGDFVFAYRDGVSGNGNYIFNIYDVPTKTWRRLINSPLTDGEGLRNAYPVGPTLGPDGWWHLVYVWRETADAATNHDLSYAKSRDLVNWETGTGRALALPITLGTSDIVDPVPVMGGMINNNTKVGFDSQNRPVVGYHKFDAAGNTQLFNARVEGGRWVTHQASSWAYRWDFGGTGTLIFQIQLEGVRPGAGGSLTQLWYHMQYGGWNAFQLNEATLATTAMLGRTLPYPIELERVESTTAGMGVRWASDTGAGPDPGILYMLRWETLPENQDMARATIPPATRLRVYGFRKGPS